MCFTFNEQSLQFEPLGLNSNLTFVRNSHHWANQTNYSNYNQTNYTESSADFGSPYDNLRGLM